VIVGERQEQSRQLVQSHLSTLAGVRIGKRLMLEELQSEDLRSVFDRCDFFLLRYPRYPVEVVPVPPLRVNNLFVACEGQVTPVSDEVALRELFLQRFPLATDEAVMAAGVRVWLLLVQELHQDGFLSFGSPSARTTEASAEGFLDVDRNTGEGRLSVVMEFDRGRLVNVNPGGEVRAGLRRFK
jgi:hypothetical protein